MVTTRLVCIESMLTMTLENNITGHERSLKSAIERVCKNVSEERSIQVDRPLAVARVSPVLYVVTVTPEDVWILTKGVYSRTKGETHGDTGLYYSQMRTVKSKVR